MMAKSKSSEELVSELVGEVSLIAVESGGFFRKAGESNVEEGRITTDV
jgi:hypothetical protein